MSFTFSEFPDTAYYHSDLRQILDRLREIDATLDSYDTVIAQLKQEIANIQGLYSRVSALETATADLAKIRSRLTDLESEVVAIINQESNDVKRLDKRIDALKAEVDGLSLNIDSFFQYVDANIDDVKYLVAKVYYELLKQIKDLEIKTQIQIEDLITRIDNLDTSVKNPWHQAEGRIPPQKNNDYIYMDLADNIPTAKEYAELGYSARDYSKLSMRAISYNRFGKDNLNWHWVYNPITGRRQEISNVLTALIDYFSATSTADEYTALGLTADEYTALDLTALSYYSYF